MIVMYKDPSVLEGYFALDPHTQYCVLGIASELSARTLGPEALILIDVPSFGMRFGAIPFSQLEIIDDSYPESWSGALLADHISYPEVIFGFPELHDAEFYVRLHDQNETPEDVAIVKRYFDEYGGNVVLTSDEDMLHDSEYLRITGLIEEYFANTVSVDGRNNDYIQEHSAQYVSNVRTIAKMILAMITKTHSMQEKKFWAMKVANYAGLLESLQRVDEVKLSPDVAEIVNDIANPLDYSKLIEKATAKRYLLQK